jgi:tetratricopeptide (TPR) repeat protein
MYDGTQIEQKSYAITQIPVFATYLRLLILPVRQNLDYDYPVFKTLFNIRVLMGFLLLIAYGYLIEKNYKRNPLIVFGLIWIPLTLLVESSVIVIKDVIFEHRLYLPMVGFAIAGVLMVERVIADKSLQSIFFLVGLWAIILGYLTYQRSRVWQSEISLWQDVVAKSPKKARGYDYLGVAYQLQGQYELGLKMHQQAIKLNRLYGEPYHNAGSALIALKRYTEAEEYYRTAIEKDSKQAYFYQGLGQALLKQNKFVEAREALNKSLELLPGYVRALGSLKKLQELESKLK